MNTVNINNSIFLAIDIQEKLVKMLNDNSVENEAYKLLKTAEIMNIPTVITEQYPKGLGTTVDNIKSCSQNAFYFEKTYFSALKDTTIKEEIKSFNRKQIILFGIETHICVLQTAIDLLNEGYEVFIVKSACGSRNPDNKETALKRLRHLKAQIVTTEMVIFELLETSKHQNFKEVQALIK